MANGNNKMLMLGIAGGAAVAIYLVVQKQKQAAAAASIATSTGVAVEPPSFLDTLLGKIPDAVKSFMDKGKELDAAMKARGPKHYAAWKEATAKGRQFYAAEDNLKPGVVSCFATATGAQVPLKSCPAPQQQAALLEGY